MKHQVEFLQQRHLRLSESERLREFALEYVKQIVTRAAELAAGVTTSTQDHQATSDEELAARRLVAGRQDLRAEAAKIDAKFRLFDSSGQQAAATAAKTTSRLTRDSVQQQRRSQPRPDDERGRRFQERVRVNWHLLVACFQSCLPSHVSTLAETMPSAAGRQMP